MKLDDKQLRAIGSTISMALNQAKKGNDVKAEIVSDDDSITVMLDGKVLIRLGKHRIEG